MGRDRLRRCERTIIPASDASYITPHETETPNGLRDARTYTPLQDSCGRPAAEVGYPLLSRVSTCGNPFGFYLAIHPDESLSRSQRPFGSF